MKDRCTNMNHGRTNAPVRYCPKCGDVLNKSASGSCNDARHTELRRSQLTFCTDCGKKLAIGK